MTGQDARPESRQAGRSGMKGGEQLRRGFIFLAVRANLKSN